MRTITHLTLSPEGLAFNPATGDSFVVNESAATIFKAIQAGNPVDEVVRILSESYELPREQAERDVIDFQDRLRSLGLL